MDEKLQDLLEAKEGVDEAAPDADLNNKYTTKRKYIRTKHGDLEGKLFCFYNKLRITDTRASTNLFCSDYEIDPFKFGTVVRNSPKYEVIPASTNLNAKPDGPVPEYATLIANSETLFGQERFIMDNVITQEECNALIEMAKEGKIGDGYEGDENPHRNG